MGKLIKWFTFISLIILSFICPMLGQSSSDPLTEQEQREILLRLDELKLARQQITLYERNLEAERVQVIREKEWQQRQEQLWQREKELLGRERDLYKGKAEEFEKAYLAAIKKRGWGCKLGKIFTIGIYRCH